MAKLRYKQSRHKPRAEPRAIDPLNNPDDRMAAEMACCLFTNKYIASETGLTIGQVGGRVRWCGIKRIDIRNGKSRFSKILWESAHRAMDTEFMKYLKHHV